VINERTRDDDDVVDDDDRVLIKQSAPRAPRLEYGDRRG